MASPVRFGIAGMGNEGHQIAPYFAREPSVQLTAVADVRPAALDAFHVDHPDVQTFESVAAMCESGTIDAVWIATPNPFHAEHTICAARAGVHIILEKPMTLSLEEAEAMVDTAEHEG